MTVLRKIDNSEQQKVLQYLRPFLGECLYMYLDIETYGLEGDVVSAWVQDGESGEYVFIAMEYADSFQLFCESANYGKADIKAVCDLVAERGSNRAYGPKFVIESMMGYIGDDFDESYGHVLELKNYRKMKSKDFEVEVATVGDLPEIVDLVMMDEELGQSYERQGLIDQFAARLEDGTGANYIIRKDGAIVAHVAFSMIAKEFVIVSYLIVHPDHRDYPYGAFLDSYYINDLLPAMGKRAFAFMHDERRIKLFQIMKNDVLGEYGKILRKGM